MNGMPQIDGLHRKTRGIEIMVHGTMLTTNLLPNMSMCVPTISFHKPINLRHSHDRQPSSLWILWAARVFPILHLPALRMWDQRAERYGEMGMYKISCWSHTRLRIPSFDNAHLKW